MEAQGYYIFYFNGSEVRIRYEYKFYNSTMQVIFDGRDLANLLDLTRQRTLKDMNFEACMEIEQEDGNILNKIIKLPEVILNSTSNELRNNLSLYEKPDLMSSN